MALPKCCPLCSAGVEHQSVVTQHVFGAKKGPNRAFYHCESCDVRYQFPGLTAEEEAHFYLNEFEGFMTERAGVAGGWQEADAHINANESTRQRRMGYLEEHLSPGCCLLEVGCSSGFMLYPLREMDINCTGIEPSGLFGEYVNKKGVSVYPSMEDLIEKDPSARFDIIMHFFVLEHIANPLRFLKSQLELLNDGGKIVFEIPNASDALYAVYDIPEFERFYWSVAHPWYFSLASLSRLLDDLGQPYTIKLDQRYDLSNHFIWARDGKPGGMNFYSELFGADLDTLYKQKLIDSGNSDTLVAVIHKTRGDQI